MNKKIIAYILIALVVGVAAYFAYNYFTGQGDDEVETTVTTSDESETTEVVATFSEYSEASGSYSGTWFDNTFDVGGALDGSITVNDESVVLVINIYGLTFGLADPQSITITVDANGNTTYDSTAFFGTLVSVDIDIEAGTFVFNTASPIPYITGMVFDGKLTPAGVFGGDFSVSLDSGGPGVGPFEMTKQ